MTANQIKEPFFLVFSPVGVAILRTCGQAEASIIQQEEQLARQSDRRRNSLALHQVRSVTAFLRKEGAKINLCLQDEGVFDAVAVVDAEVVIVPNRKDGD